MAAASQELKSTRCCSALLGCCSVKLFNKYLPNCEFYFLRSNCCFKHYFLLHTPLPEPPILANGAFLVRVGGSGEGCARSSTSPRQPTFRFHIWPIKLRATQCNSYNYCTFICSYNSCNKLTNNAVKVARKCILSKSSNKLPCSTTEQGKARGGQEQKEMSKM